MTFNRSEAGELTVLAQRNVDTGMGLERLAMFLNRHTSVWETDELHDARRRVGGAAGVADGLDRDGAAGRCAS